MTYYRGGTNDKIISETKVQRRDNRVRPRATWSQGIKKKLRIEQSNKKEMTQGRRNWSEKF